VLAGLVVTAADPVASMLVTAGVLACAALAVLRRRSVFDAATPPPRQPPLHQPPLLAPSPDERR
jgi:hypothetical protein